jgi:hypothetical protein
MFMTWDTPLGTRIVAGNEAKLLKYALAAMVDTFEMDTQAGCEPVEYGVTLFDELSWPNRLGLLEQAAQFLFAVTRSPPAPSAVLDASVAALFGQIMHEVEFELESIGAPASRERVFWRSLISEAFSECFQDEIAEHRSADKGWKSSEESNEHHAGRSGQSFLPNDAFDGWTEQAETGDDLLPENLRADESRGDSFSVDEPEYDGIEDMSFEMPAEYVDSISEYQSFSIDDLDEEGANEFDEEDEDLQDFLEQHGLELDDEEEDPYCESLYIQPPAPTCRDLDVWYQAIDALTDRILSDRDYDLADRFLDAPPSVAHELRTTLGITPDYFVTPAPEPQDTPKRLAAKLRQIVGA